jgi:hypothetical protein
MYSPENMTRHFQANTKKMLQNHDTELSAINRKLQQLSEKIDGLQKTTTAEIARTNDLDKKLTDVSSDIRILHQKNDRNASELTAHDKKLADISSEMRNLNHKHERRTSEQRAHEKKLEETLAQIKSLEGLTEAILKRMMEDEEDDEEDDAPDSPVASPERRKHIYWPNAVVCLAPQEKINLTIKDILDGNLESPCPSIHWDHGKYHPLSDIPRKIIKALNDAPGRSLSTKSLCVLTDHRLKGHRNQRIQGYLRELHKQGIILVSN